jgi:1-phosphofructokinase family hexose kinase
LILTLTPNPAIDQLIYCDRLAFEDRTYILDTTHAAGGRGINASRVLHAFGAQTLAIFPAGDKSGKRMRKLLAESGFPFEVVRVAGDIRTNLIITDRTGLTAKLNEPGPRLSDAELERLEAAVEAHLPGASWVLLCGSLPPGAPAEFYCRILRKAREHSVETLVDTDGEILLDILDESPSVIAPNQQEAERMLDKALITRQHLRDAVERMHSMGARSVILTLGSRGALCRSKDLVLEVLPPRVEAISPIGAGDALNAAFAWSMERKNDFEEAVRWGVAAGTASARRPGVSFAALDETAEIYQQVTVRQIR